VDNEIDVPDAVRRRQPPRLQDDLASLRPKMVVIGEIDGSSDHKPHEVVGVGVLRGDRHWRNRSTITGSKS
jgi:hypothetical protein